MITKLAHLKTAFAAGDLIGALRIAAKFPRLGDQAVPITRAWAAHQNPDFYRQISQDPVALIVAGVNALRDRYAL